MSGMRSIVLADLRRLEGVCVIMAVYLLLLVALSIFDIWGQGISLIFFMFFYLWCANCTNVNTEYFYACVPVSRRDVVLAKYINSILGALVPGACFMLIRIVVGHTFWTILKMMICMSFVFAAVAIPLLLHLDALKARYCVTGLYALVIAGLSAFGAFTGWSFEMRPQISVGVMLVSVGALVFSYFLSIRLYDRREFLL